MGCVRCMQGLCCVFVFGDGGGASGESFRSTTGVYSRPSQLFINKILYIRLLSVVCLVSSVLMVIVGAAFFICFLEFMFEV